MQENYLRRHYRDIDPKEITSEKQEGKRDDCILLKLLRLVREEPRKTGEGEDAAWRDVEVDKDLSWINKPINRPPKAEGEEAKVYSTTELYVGLLYSI